MAEYDGSGYPLSYCVMSTVSSTEIGKRKRALVAWATCLRDTYDVRPTFVHADKCMAGIGMARTVWIPKVNLCWWHVDNSVEDRLEKNKLSTTPYDAERANSEFPFISIVFVPPGKADPMENEGGSGGNRDHAGIADVPQRDSPNAITLRISIPSHLRQLPNTSESPPAPTTKSISPEHISIPQNQETSSHKLTIRLPAVSDKENHRPEPNKGVDNNVSKDTKRTFCPVEYRQPIIDMMERHYCAHPLIPGYSSPTPEGIREWAVKQMYKYCVDHDLREVWAYLWENWYRPGRWDLWARSCHPEIPILKTTMILESQ
jgi:hypothetical protein